MTVIICLAVLVTALLSIAVFNCNAFFCMAAAAAAAALCVLKLLFKRIKPISALLSLLTFALLICCCYIPSGKTAYGYKDYLGTYREYMKALDSLKDEKAEKLYAELTEKYGESDDMRYTEGLKNVVNGDTDEAERIAGSFENKSDIKYFLLREDIISAKYASDESKNQDMIRELRYLYEEALRVYPDWAYPNKKLGIILFTESDFAKAEFYLTKAYAYNDVPDGETLFFLGASYAERGLYEKSYECFDRAVKYDLDEKYQNNIVAYLQKSGWEASENET